jgi:hypothetical protein
MQIVDHTHSRLEEKTTFSDPIRFDRLFPKMPFFFRAQDKANHISIFFG